MDRLLPVPSAPIDSSSLEELYVDRRRRGVDRPWVMLNMVASVDGGATLDGVSGGLGGVGDRAAFAMIRAQADVVLVGASTVRAEGYRAGPASDEVRARRRRAGVAEELRFAVVSRSLELDLTSSLFTAAPLTTVVVTTSDADRAQRDEVERVAEVVVAGDERVDPAAAVEALGALGARVVLAEGGPGLNGQLLAADLVDEVLVTIAPALVGGGGPRLAHGPDLERALPLELAHVVRSVEDELLLRYLRRRDGEASGTGGEG